MLPSQQVSDYSTETGAISHLQATRVARAAPCAALRTPEKDSYTVSC